MRKHSLIVGGAGFIGTNLVKKLLSIGNLVTVIDDLSRGRKEFLDAYVDQKEFKFIEFDVSFSCDDAFNIATKFCQIDEVWHLAANSDIPAGVLNPIVDLKNTFMTTFEVLRSMKKFNVKTIHFASSSAIYGDLGQVAITENIGPLQPISNYGAMKLASEAQISAACESYLDRANIFRFPNVVGVPATHGVILDFVFKLLKNNNELNVLGDGTQQKSYLHVSDLIDAMLLIIKHQVDKKMNVVNIGPIDEGVTVNWIANQVINKINPNALIIYGIGNKGWVGDVPRFIYSTELLQSFGWKPKLGSSEAVIKAIDEIILKS